MPSTSDPPSNSSVPDSSEPKGSIQSSYKYNLSNSEVMDLAADAVKCLLQDPFLQLSEEHEALKELADNILSCETKIGELAKRLMPVIEATRSSLLSCQFGKMWTTFSQLINDDAHILETAQLLHSFNDQLSERVYHMFSACLCDSLVKCMTANEKEKVKKSSTQKVETISKNDRSVLFYVAGYLLKGLSMKMKDPKKAAQVESLCSGKESVDPEISKWLQSRDRGELTQPTRFL